MMIRKLTIIFAVLALAAVAYGDMKHHMANAPSSPAFDKMKNLVGEWKANVPGMGDVIATYAMHSDGSALLEELKMPDGASMITVYYPTSSGVAMTHYCSGHNQPHMVAKSSGDNLAFKAVSYDNLASKDAQHMKAVNFAFKDADHFTATWTNTEKGKEMPVPFNFTRVR